MSNVQELYFFSCATFNLYRPTSRIDSMRLVRMAETKGAYHLRARKSGNFGLKSNSRETFPEIPIRNCGVPSEVLLERPKFSYHLLYVPVPSLSSNENNYRKSNSKWKAPFRSVGLLILENPLPLFKGRPKGRPNRFILTNAAKHPKYHSTCGTIRAHFASLSSPNMVK